MSNIADYFVNYLITEQGLTDAFGVPGGVILKFLEALERKKDVLSAHLLYHEQSAGFAACGYSQASGKLGVAYATRGPGITNMVTCIAEAYQESLPVLFVTAHSQKNESSMRFEFEQELDLTNAVTDFCKYAVSIDSVDNALREISKSCKIAMEGRKGPILLDFFSGLWDSEVPETLEKNNLFLFRRSQEKLEEAICEIECALRKSKRPVILIGDGIRQSRAIEEVKYLTEIKIPVISSRASQDLLSGATNYYGYIGSHGIRYGNSILVKSDLIVSIGNRMAFPLNSQSFSPMINQKNIIRIDIDTPEFERKFSKCKCFCVDAKTLLKELVKKKNVFNGFDDWMDVCNILRDKLKEHDVSEPVKNIIDILKLNEFSSYVCDVGNNEFWFSRAYEYLHLMGNVFHSKSFGTLGVGLGRAIGVYYATQKPVMCVIGDQGLQYNIQELQYIAHWNLPITILVINNRCSGMIQDHEQTLFCNKLIHVSESTGYSLPEFSRISCAYGIPYMKFENEIKKWSVNNPQMIEISVNSDTELTPTLPRGRGCDDMEPLMDRKLYEFISNL